MGQYDVDQGGDLFGGYGDLSTQPGSGYGGYAPESSMGYNPMPQAPNQAQGIGSNMNAGADLMGAAAMVPSPASPFLAAGSLGLKVAGTATSIYGQFKAREEAEARYKEQLKQYEIREEERMADKQKIAEERDRKEVYFASDFSQGIEDRLAGGYKGYATPGAR